MSANFNDLQQIATANNTDQMMVRIDNGAVGPDGFGRITISGLRNVFTETLTAADTKVKQASAQWDATYSLVNAKSSVFTLVNSNSANWNAAYDAVTGYDFNLGSKVFTFAQVESPVNPDDADQAKLVNNTALFKVVNLLGDALSSNLVEIFPYNNIRGIVVDQDGRMGINYESEWPSTLPYNFNVYGNARIDNQGGGDAFVVNGDALINGSLSALSATFITSTITQTSALSVNNTGVGPALQVSQAGAQPIVRFLGDSTSITIDNTGSLSALNNLYGNGKIVFGPGNASTASYSYVFGQNNNDGNLNNVFILGSNVTAPAANYTYVNNLSAPGLLHAGGYSSTNWNSVYSNVNTTSSSWSSTYATTNANSATWNTGGGFTTAFTAAISNSLSATPTHSLTAVSLSSNVDVALVAKGTGATLAQIPNNATSGGNARGTYATDLQKSRFVRTQVASGIYSVIAGGGSNTASSSYTTVAGGYSNGATGLYSSVLGGITNGANAESSTVAGGESNIASGTHSTIAGGFSNAASGNSSGIAGGASNVANNDYATVAGGTSNTASGEYSTVGGGQTNISSGTHTTVAGGKSNTAAGSYATVAGGESNTSSATHATVAGGFTNIASDLAATVGGGNSNDATNDYATVAGGNSNTASGNSATIGGGFTNTASSTYSTIAGGALNTASKSGSTVIGGQSNSASGFYSSVLGGSNNVSKGDYSVSFGVGVSATNYGEIAHSAAYFLTLGDSKSSTMLLKTTTTVAGSAQCYLDNFAEEITMPPNSTYAYTTTIVGLSSHANSTGLYYILRGFAKCNNTGVVTVYPATSDLTQRLPTSLNASMSAAGDRLRVVVYSPAGTHYWHAKVQGEFLQF